MCGPVIRSNIQYIVYSIVIDKNGVYDSSVNTVESQQSPAQWHPSALWRIEDPSQPAGAAWRVGVVLGLCAEAGTGKRPCHHGQVETSSAQSVCRTKSGLRISYTVVMPFW